MKLDIISRLFVLNCVFLMTGCSSIPNDLRSNPMVQGWINQIKQDEDSTRIWWFIHMHVAGYNEAVWVGQVEKIDASPFEKDTDAKGMTLAKAHVVYREYSVSAKPTLLFDCNTFTNKTFPKPGEMWAVFGIANNSGIWFVKDTLRVDHETDGKASGKRSPLADY